MNAYQPSKESDRERHIHSVEHKNKYGTWEETELRCPETGRKQMGEVNDWAYCIHCGRELHTDTDRSGGGR